MNEPGPTTMAMADAAMWRERAEKAEAELERVKAAAAEMRPLVGMLECKCDSVSNGGYTCPRCHALSSSAGTGYVRSEDVVPLVEALKPFARIPPVRLGSIPPDKLWLWKPCDSTNPDTFGISAANVDYAREALAHAREKGFQ